MARAGAERVTRQSAQSVTVKKAWLPVTKGPSVGLGAGGSSRDSSNYFTGAISVESIRPLPRLGFFAKHSWLRS